MSHCDLDILLLSEGFLLHLLLHLRRLQRNHTKQEWAFFMRHSMYQTPFMNIRFILWMAHSHKQTHTHMQYLEVSEVWLQVRFQWPHRTELQHRTEGKDAATQLQSCKENRRNLASIISTVRVSTWNKSCPASTYSVKVVTCNELLSYLL